MLLFFCLLELKVFSAAERSDIAEKHSLLITLVVRIFDVYDDFLVERSRFQTTNCKVTNCKPNIHCEK